MSRELRIVDRHLRHWKQVGLISQDLEDGLRSSSQELQRQGVTSVLRTALALLGGGLLLAGLVLIVAENWQLLHHSVKLGGWALIQAALLYGAHAFGRRWPERPFLSEALALVAGGWVLAGIALVSQIYQLDSRPQNGIWFWLVLLLPAAWALPRRAIPAVTFVALVTALVLEVGETDSWIHATRAAGPWLWIAVPLVSAAVVSWLPQAPRWLRDWSGAWAFGAGQCFLLVLGAAQELDRSDLGRAWWVVGAGLAAALVVPRRVWPNAWDALTARVVLVATLAPWLLMGKQYDDGETADMLAVGLAWVIQLGVAILVLRTGAQAGSTSWVNLGYLALLAGILTRYFDFFGAFLEGGAALALTGVLLLFILFSLEKARRRTLGKEATS